MVVMRPATWCGGGAGSWVGGAGKRRPARAQSLRREDTVTDGAPYNCTTSTGPPARYQVGHQDLHQLLDPRSIYFSARMKFKGGYPHEDAGMLFEEVIISSNGRTIERIRNAQYIQHFQHGYNLSRSAKMKRREEGFDRCEDRTMQRWTHNS